MANVSKPTNLADTLNLMLDRALPTYPINSINLANLNFTLNATSDAVKKSRKYILYNPTIKIAGI